MTETKLNIFIIDDHELFRKGTRKLLEQCAWVASCEDSGTIADGVSLLEKRKPDVLLLDLYIGKEASFYIVPKIKELSPKTKIIILTVSESPEDLTLAAKHKVDGYLTKNTSFAKMDEYIKSIHKGQICISESLAGALYKALVESDSRNSLTQQEQVILGYLNHGLSNKEIAEKMGLSLSTVKYHVSNIIHKMNVTRRYQLKLKS